MRYTVAMAFGKRGSMTIKPSLIAFLMSLSERIIEVKYRASFDCCKLLGILSVIFFASFI